VEGRGREGEEGGREGGRGKESHAFPGFIFKKYMSVTK